MEWSLGWSHDPQALEKAYELAERAIDLDDAVPDAHCLLAFIYLWKKEYEQAIALSKRSIDLNPNYADALAGQGDILSFAGRPEEAIGLIEKAMRLNPIHPVWYLWDLGHAYFLTGRYDEATEAFKRALNRNPGFWPAHAYLAATYVELGRKEEAQAEAAMMLRFAPNLSLEVWRQRLPYRDPSVLERVLEALRGAGVMGAQAD
jgi:tetratricopeptide (TPR) repeat protein